MSSSNNAKSPWSAISESFVGIRPAGHTEIQRPQRIQLLGAGTIFGKTILSESFYTPITIFILAPGAFFVLACLVAARNKIMNRKVKNGEMEEIPAGCGDCSACGNSCCSSKSFFDMSVDNKKEETKAASEEKAENK